MRDFGGVADREYRYAEMRSYSHNNLGCLALAANAAVSVFITSALLYKELDPIWSILAGAIFYVLTALSSLLISSGSLTEIMRNAAEHRTQRRLYEMQLAQQGSHRGSVSLVPDPAEAQTETTAILPKNFVPASPPVAQSVWWEAKTWVVGLFDMKTGEPDPNKVFGPETADPWRIRVRMPSKKVIDYLLDRKVLKHGKSGYALHPFCTLRTNALKALDHDPVPPTLVG